MGVADSFELFGGVDPKRKRTRTCGAFVAICVARLPAVPPLAVCASVSCSDLFASILIHHAEMEGKSEFAGLQLHSLWTSCLLACKFAW